MPSRLQFAGCTDVGMVREHNEDQIAWNSEVGIAVLADGMGGHLAGEVASRLAVHTVVDELRGALTEAPLSESGSDDGTDAAYLCVSAVTQANTVVYQAAQADPSHAGMGTTIVVALCGSDTCTVAHIGDSRLYLYRQGNLQQITEDHSVVQDAIRRGLCSPEEAKRTFGKNIITRALGVGADVEVDTRVIQPAPGDVLLLCSDGLTDQVQDADIALTLGNFGANLDGAARDLVSLANARGGHDNVSVVLVRYPLTTE